MERTHYQVSTVALLGFSLALVILLFVSFLRAKNNSERVAMYSCVKSIRAELLTRGSRSLQLDKNGEAWKTISGVEQTKLFQQIAAEGKLDCAMLRFTQKGVLDAWGEPILVAERYRQGHNAQIIVASKGPDKTPMTADDIVAPQNDDWPTGL